MKFQNAVIAVVATFFGILAEADALSIKVQGEDVAILDVQFEYDQQQDLDGEDLVLSGTTVELTGNVWKALGIPEDGIDIHQDTILKFEFDLKEAAELEAICLDENLELSALKGDENDGSRCFVVANEQGWVHDMINVPDMLEEGETRIYEIPVGQFFTGTVNYLVFIQDNDEDRSVGKSSFSNIEIVDDEHDNLKVMYSKQEVLIPHDQVEYYLEVPGDQDTPDHYLDISEDGSSVQVAGNSWKALKIPEPHFEITGKSMVELDFSLQEEADFHLFCLDDDQNMKNDIIRCFQFAGTQATDYSVNTDIQTKVGETTHYKLPIGHFLKGVLASYMPLIQDNDTNDKSSGRSTYSNIQIYEDVRPDLKIMVYDKDESIVGGDTQDQFHTWDSRLSIMDVSADGAHARLLGNMARALPLPNPVTVTKATQLLFSVKIDEGAQFHCIALDEDNTYNDKRLFCPRKTTNVNAYLPSSQTEVGDGYQDFIFDIGLEYTGIMNYLVLVQRNTDDKTKGDTTFSNIVIKNRASPKIHVFSEGKVNEMSILNDQTSYENNQDTSSNLIDVSEDGVYAYMSGNVWKWFPLDDYVITDNTILRITVEIIEETEVHFLCLDSDNDLTNGARCFMFSGTQSHDKNVIYYGLSQLNAGETGTYYIRISEFYKGTMDRIVFGQDNDAGDRTKGESKFSNIAFFESEDSCLKDKGYNLTFTECTSENFISEIEKVMEANECPPGDGWSELMSFFDLSLKTQVQEKINDICSSAYGTEYLPFDEVTGKGFQFTAEFLDGGTTWNYDRELEGAMEDGGILSKEAGMVKIIDDTYAATKPISWPDVHNLQGCNLRAAMCCYVSNRVGEATEPEGNSEACYMDFKKAQQSSHVRDGYSIYGDNIEGSLNCHGFAWGNDGGEVASALKGSNLFHVAMKHELYDLRNVEEIPGAPLCGCVEQMPVVTTADCTKVTADTTVRVEYDPEVTEFIATLEIANIAHTDCIDLKTHYNSLDTVSPIQKEAINKHLVGEGECRAATESFLAEKGFQFKG